MRTILLSKKKLLKGNHRFCLSALRATSHCFECSQYRPNSRHKIDGLSEKQKKNLLNHGWVEERGYLVKYGPMCESAIKNEEYDTLIAEKYKAIDEYNVKMEEINKKINEL